MNRALLASSTILVLLSGAVAAAYAFRAVGHALSWEELIPVALMLVPCAAVPVAALFIVAAFVMRRLGVEKARWLSQGPWTSASALVIGSALLLGPSGAFHHMIRFGILGYMVVDCESPADQMSIPFGRCGIRASASLLAAHLAVWLLSLWVLHMILRHRAARP